MPRRKVSAKWIAAILVVCIGLVAGCAGGALSIGPVTFGGSPAPTGILLYADPGVTILRSGGDIVRYEPGMEVVSGDTIETADGEAVIDYDDGSAVIFNRATRVRIGSITLFFGEIFARIKSIASRGGGRVVTDELSASVEGTEFGVRRDLAQTGAPLGRVQVYVRQGRVLCAPVASARWSPVAVTANQAFEVDGYRAEPSPRAVDARALSRWADEAERRLRRPRLPEIRPELTVPIGPPPTRERRYPPPSPERRDPSASPG